MLTELVVFINSTCSFVIDTDDQKVLFGSMWPGIMKMSGKLPPSRGSGIDTT